MRGRRADDIRLSPFDRLSRLLQSAIRRQNQFSVVSAVVAVTLAAILLVDYAVGHPHIQRGAVALWMGGYLAFTALPQILGRRYPRWVGLLFVGYVTFWSVLSLMQSSHAHVEVNALLEAPVVAVYLCWFFPAWIARTGLAIHLLAIALAVLVGPRGYDHEFSSALALLYAVLIAGFCLEGGVYLRRRAEQEARRDPLTGVLNRRGFQELGARALRRAHRSGAPLTLAAIDFDDFKQINDTGGHAAGDAALRESSALWRRGLGPDDLVARIGGDGLAAHPRGRARRC